MKYLGFVLLVLSGYVPSYLTFAKGVQNVHNAAIAEEAQVRERQVLQKADDAFGSVVRSFTLSATDESAVVLNAAIEKMYTDTGRNPQDAFNIIKREVGHLYSKAFVGGDGDPERFIKVMGGITTGRKGENGKMVKFREDAGAFAIWSNGVKANGASIMQQQQTRKDILYNNQQKKIMREWREARAKNPDYPQTKEGKQYFYDHIERMHNDGDETNNHFYQAASHEVFGGPLSINEYKTLLWDMEKRGLTYEEGASELANANATTDMLQDWKKRTEILRHLH